MLNEQQKRSFLASAIKPLADSTLRFLTQVAGVIDQSTGEFRGTGFFCSIAGRQVLVTAAHVIRELDADGRFLGPAFSRGDGEPPAIVPGRIVFSIPHDLAIYFPSEPFPMGSQKAYWPDDRIDRNAELLTKDALFVHGFPARFTRFTTLGGGAMISESLPYGAMMRFQERDIPSQERPGFDRALPDYNFLAPDFLEPHQFAINFWAQPDFFLNETANDQAQVRKRENWSEVFRSDGGNSLGDSLPGQLSRGAFGLSGSPVWRIGAVGRPIRDWTPQWARLVGIVTGWNEQERVLIATRASHLLDLAATQDAATTKA
jgi:hypothetical protein